MRYALLEKAIRREQEEVIPIQVIVIVSPDVARALHKLDRPTVESEALLKMIEDFDLTLQPMHPDSSDPSLQSYFTLEVSGDAAAQEIIDRLQALDSVVAAYVKPPDELP